MTKVKIINKYKWIIILPLLLLAGGIPLVSSWLKQDIPSIGFEQAALSIQTKRGVEHFTVELALTNKQHAHGLMFRETLLPDKGMLFIFHEVHHASLWMKNTLISLDMLFIDSSGRIVYIAPQTTPESTDIIRSPRPVRAVLEVAAGTAKAKHIEVGDRVLYEAFQ